MNILINLSAAQWEWIKTASLDLGIDPSLVLFRLLELGQPVLARQIRLKPRKRAALRVVRP